MNRDKQTFSFKKIVTPDQVLENHTVTINQKKINKIQPVNNKDLIDYKFDDYVVYPALINAHDHLLGSYYPRVRGKEPYFTWKPWDNDLKRSPIYEERGNIENIDLYYLGSYRNLISGVLTVSDHIPHKINDPFIHKMPIRVIKDYSLAHEVSEYDLKWGDGVEIEHKKAITNNEPFITHIEEGFDEESMKGVDYLIEMGALTEHTVLIHGIALSDEDILNISKHHANLVWCPFSNFFMFERTARIKEVVAAGVNTSIGTDSPMSGGLNILDEIKFAKQIYREMYEEEISNELIVKMITSNPAKALRLDKDMGSLEEGKLGEFVLIKDKDQDPYTNLVEAELEDISLVFYKGKPIYGDELFEDLFKKFELSYSKFKVNQSNKIISVDNPVNLLNRVRDAVGFKKDIPFLPISE